MTYRQLYDGDSVSIEKGGHWNLQCCDCGLVHRLDFKVSSEATVVEVHQENRRTAAVRRGRDCKKKIKELARKVKI